MKFERINNINHKLYNEAINLYKNSFPYHEQREEESQIEIINNPLYHFEIIIDNDRFIGEILYWDFLNFKYIEHFCILPNMRNLHYGQRILEELKKPLILEIDPPIDDISRRRLNFYKRCGFVENKYMHIHPPYHKNYCGHQLLVMSTTNPLAKVEYDKFKVFLTKIVMNKAFK